MAENPPNDSPETGESEPSAESGGCPSCRGSGSKFVMMRRSEAAAGAAAETALLGRAQEPCLRCSGTGKAAS
jgi:hypothetical protein